MQGVLDEGNGVFQSSGIQLDPRNATSQASLICSVYKFACSCSSFSHGLRAQCVASDSVGDCVLGDSLDDCVVSHGAGDCAARDCIGNCAVGDSVGDFVVCHRVGADSIVGVLKSSGILLVHYFFLSVFHNM